MFKIALVGLALPQYIDKAIMSWLTQASVDFQIQVILEPMGDGVAEATYAKYNNIDPRLSIKVNTNRQYAIPNFLEAFKMMNPVDDDILVMVDADDWAYSNFSLAIVKSYYDKQPNLLVTHGSWVSYPNPNANTNNAPYTEAEFNKGVRKVAWRASHLRTFKYKVWKYLKDDQLRDAKGNYFKTAWDLCLVWPLLEISGFNRIKFIPNILYVYNQETPFNDTKLYLQEQMYYTDYIAAMQPYPYMENP